ncbi:Fe-S cluster assembly protein SufD [Ichthyobacterium seriolicida]|uniref:FeS assembly protein SufD n=1 Tax=Ichthyobacterium seriolicida TaxID=242600 RepID=A0A1J1DXN9_9FLAO|nr:Fe-S cluster assembly protein SufD [Ichthyobacterium seriolicida]BAV94601.1 FeS assembly protein SufD [Ichthyobacterium seriolicida]
MTELKRHILSFFDEKNFKSDLEKFRLDAVESFSQSDFPTVNDEEWKVTDLSKIVSKKYNLELNRNTSEKYDFEKYLLGMDTYRVIVINGLISKELSSVPEFFNISSIRENTSHERVKKFFSKILSRDIISDLNTSLFHDGVFIEVPANTTVDKPVEILNISFHDTPAINSLRNLVVVNENAEIKIIDRHQSLSENVFVNYITEIFVDKNARGELYKLQMDDSTNSLIDNTFISQEKGSTASVGTFSFGSEFIRNNLNFYLDGQHSTANLYGISILSDNQLVDNHTCVEHRLPNCDSNEIYRGIYHDNSRGVFNGKVIVHKDAQKTSGFQRNDNILLSDRAKINTKPQLEIFADDVKCSHGCTVGQLDKDAIFYLRSRGMREEVAKGMIMYAFFSEILENIHIPQLKDYLESFVSKKLGIDV